MTLSLIGSDDFNRADGALGSPWVAPGSVAWSVYSNVAKGPASVVAMEQFGDRAHADAAIEFTPSAYSINMGSASAVLRSEMNPNVAHGGAGYFFTFWMNSEVLITRYASDGAKTTLGHLYSFTKSDIIRSESIGTSLSVYRNGTLQTFLTDSVIASGFVGLGSLSGYDISYLDDFKLYAEAVAVSLRVPARRMLSGIGGLL